MKRIITIIGAFFLFGGLTLQAAPVTPERALDVAKKVFAAQSATKSVGNVKLIWDGEFDVTTKSVQPAIYVVARDGGGFVIIAGDDNVEPVLAVSDHNEFKVEDMPANVRWWMDRMKAYVRSVRTQSPVVREKWDRLVSTKGMVDDGTNVTVVSDQLTQEWGQG